MNQSKSHSQYIQVAKSSLHRKSSLFGDKLYINNKFAARIEAVPMSDSIAYYCFHFHTATGVYVLNVEQNEGSDEAAAQQAAIRKFVSESEIYRFRCEEEADPYLA